MIPKVVHQTARNASIPSHWVPFQTRVRELHPEWEYRLWTDTDNLAFVKSRYPDLLTTYLALPKNIMRADVIRYMIMDSIGGLY
jgi:mannosyltransferase OCH1-like enzyme